MPITIIVKDSRPNGRTRTRIDEEIRDAWGSTSFQTEEDRDKCAFIERKMKESHGSDDNSVTAAVINRVK